MTALVVNFFKSVSEQLELFNLRPAYRVEQPQKLMSKDALLKWKARIFKHQQRTLNTELITQYPYCSTLVRNSTDGETKMEWNS